MNSKSKLVEKVLEVIEKRGRRVVQQAIYEILKSEYGGGIVSSALKYYAKVALPNVLPMLPALMSLSCEMTNGNPEETRSIGTAMVLLLSSSDLHDDVIDNSTWKYSKKTVLGRFGASIALLAGDILLAQGEAHLQRACEELPREQKREILNLTHEALFEICRAEAKETQLWKKDNIPPKEYLKVINMRGVAAEVHCRIGGIVADADIGDVELLGRYGRTVGMLSIIKDEFLDTLDYLELKNRIKKECPPLPVLYALQDPEARKRVKPLLEDPLFSREDAGKLSKVVFSSRNVQILIKKLQRIASKEIKTNALLQEDGLGKEASSILKVVSETF